MLLKQNIHMEKLNLKTLSQNFNFQPTIYISIFFLIFLFLFPSLNKLSAFVNISPEEEKEMGQKICEELEKTYKVWDNEIEKKRIYSVAEKIINVTERKDVEYTFKLLDIPEVNAISIPGGFIYVFKGLIELIDSDDELAAVLAHEIAHIERKHGITIYKKSTKAMFYNMILLALTKNEYIALAADMISTALLQGFGREAELEADYFALHYLIKANINPVAMLSFFDQLKRISSHYPDLLKDYFQEHPPISERIKIVENHLKSKNIDFTKGRGYRFSKELIPRKAFNGRNVGIVTDGEKVLITFYDSNKHFSVFERTKEFCKKVNSLLNTNIKNYEIKVLPSTSENEWNLIIKNKIVETITQKDSEPLNTSPSKLANLWKETLQKFLWDEFIKEGI